MTISSKNFYSKRLTTVQKDTFIELFPTAFSNTGISCDNFRITVENNSTPKVLYHYTSLDTFHKMLERMEKEENDARNKENVKSFILRGTHIEFLNDLSEFTLAFELFAKMIQEYETTIEPSKNKNIAERLDKKYWRNFVTFFELNTPPFITSFSENSDSLPMWNTYGLEGKGVALGIERFDIGSSLSDSKTGNPKWVKCIYDSDILQDIFKGSMNDVYEIVNVKDEQLVINGLPNFSLLSAYFSMLKNFAFEYEKEWRLVNTFSKYKKEKEINYFEKNGILKPYIEHKLPKKILKKIVIGPCADKEVLKKSIVMILERAGYKTDNKNINDELFVDIQFSNVPFRHI